jgi:choline dehydrogenase
MGLNILTLLIACTQLYSIAVGINIKGEMAGNVIRQLKEATEAAMKFVKEGTIHFEQEPKNEKNILPEYDFIIVGGGSAGCLLANRLSEVLNWEVLLIEAGGKENYIMDVPLATQMLQFTEANWKYLSEPSASVCLGMKSAKCTMPRGKVMGGSSTINYMIYTRGNRYDYDRWEKLGNTGWGYKDVLPYFLKHENMMVPELGEDKLYHATNGELPVSYAPYRTPLADAFLEAGKEMGQNFVDYNGKTQVGFSYLQATIRNGTRWSASRAFLHPIRHRRNLHVSKWSLVTNILIDRDTKTAYGVEFVRDKTKFVVRARKEVIVSAGAINSPQLLMLSGIGPREHLLQLGIPVIRDLKVGYNLMDHIGMMALTFVLNQSVAFTERELFGGKNWVEYMSYHRGPLTVPAGVEAIAFYDSKNPRDPAGDPDIEIMLLAGSISSVSAIHKVLAIRQDIYETVYKPIEKFYTWTPLPIVLKPNSRGRILLKSRNPFHKPRIQFDFFQDTTDLESLLLGLKRSLQLGVTKPFQRYGSRLHDIPIPGCKHFLFGSDDYWRCALRHLAFPIWHLSGTCKMGPALDRSAVVDNRLRVYGVRRLRVVDASIIPVIPAAHTHAPTMMIAEKAVDYIKQDWTQDIYKYHCAQRNNTAVTRGAVRL